MTHTGPNARTYLLAGEVFPTGIRGMGAGFAASFAKIGVVLTAFLFSILLAGIGTEPLLAIPAVTSIIGAGQPFRHRRSHREGAPFVSVSRLIDAASTSNPPRSSISRHLDPAFRRLQISSIRRDMSLHHERHD